MGGFLWGATDIGLNDFLRIGEVVMVDTVVAVVAATGGGRDAAAFEVVVRCLLPLGCARGAGLEVASITRADPFRVLVMIGNPGSLTIRVRRVSIMEINDEVVKSDELRS